MPGSAPSNDSTPPETGVLATEGDGLSALVLTDREWERLSTICATFLADHRLAADMHRDLAKKIMRAVGDA